MFPIEREARARVGVVIPVYRGQDLVTRALASVRDQRGGAVVTVVVVEDGTPPTERVPAIAAQFGAHYLLLETNQGVFTARLRGAAALPPTDYLAFLDQDDWWEPDFLDTLGAVLDQSPESPMAACNAWVAAEGGERRRLYDARRPRLRLTDIKVANQLATPSQVLIRRDVFDQMGLTPALSHPGADDWVLWLALLREGPGLYVKRPLATWFQHARAGHRNAGAMRRSEDAVVREWFPRLGLSPWDERVYRARVALDAVAQHESVSRFVAGLGAAVRDPEAFLAAMRFRRAHRREGIV